MIYDFCKVNIYSMCLLNVSRLIEVFVVIFIVVKDVEGIFFIVLGILDLEGFVRFYIYVNLI